MSCLVPVWAWPCAPMNASICVAPDVKKKKATTDRGRYVVLIFFFLPCAPMNASICVAPDVSYC